MKSKIFLSVVSLVLVSVLLGACITIQTEPTSTPDTGQDIMSTSLASTVSALSTQLASISAEQTATAAAPTATQQPTATLKPSATAAAPTATLKPIITTASGVCNKASFVADITIPDEMNLPPQSPFRKTWLVKNTGTCVWTSDYSLVYFSGDTMGAPVSKPLVSNPVLPGENALISVDLIAPSASSTDDYKKYFTYFKIKSPDGETFGVGEDGQRALYAMIRLAKTYYFVDDICSAAWSNSSGLIYCPPAKDLKTGYGVVVNKPQYENGIMGGEPALEMSPEAVADGEIVARFNPVHIIDGGRLKVLVSCVYGASGCNVTMGIKYSVDGGPDQVLHEWNKYYDGMTDFQTIKLSDFGLTGRNVAFTFYVKSKGGPREGMDRVYFSHPRIVP
jgi:hypothetical protein